MKIAGKIVWGLSGLLMICAGVYSLFNPAATLGTLALCIGLISIISGVLSIVAYYVGRNMLLGAGWLLIEGIVTILLGILVCSNGDIVASALPIIFAMWVLFSGLSKLIHAFDYKKFGISNWWVGAIGGAVLILFGILSLYKQIAGAVAIAVFVGLFLILQGIFTIVELVYAIKVETKTTKIVKSVNNMAKTIFVEGKEETINDKK